VSLRDHRVDARLGNAPGLAYVADDRHHFAPAGVGLRDERTRIAEPRDDHGHTRSEHHLDVLLRVRRIGKGLVVDVAHPREDHVDAERLVGQRPDQRDLVAQLPGRQVLAAEHAEAARLRHRGSEWRTCDRAHAGLHDRQVDAELDAEWSTKVHVGPPVMHRGTCVEVSSH
jgi:hypothetical protein